MWDILNNAPVIISYVQMKYEKLEPFEMTEIHKLEEESKIRLEYPNRSDNYNTNLNLKIDGTPTLGVSTLKAKANTAINIISYLTKDNKRRLIADNDSITITDESKYEKWDVFKKNAIKGFSYFNSLFSKIKITRISIRFINKFEIPDINDLSSFFNVTISTTNDANLKYPISGYSFKYINQIPDSKIHAIVNQATSNISDDNKGTYILDIDVLKDTKYMFDLDIISKDLDELREVKNTIFFDNITDKTKKLCL